MGLLGILPASMKANYEKEVTLQKKDRLQELPVVLQALFKKDVVDLSLIENAGMGW